MAKYFYFIENTHTAQAKRWKVKFNSNKFQDVRDLARERGLPPQKQINRLAFRGEHQREENVIYFVVSELYPSTLKAINSCLIFNRTIVIIYDIHKLVLNNFNSKEYQILQAIVKEHRNEYIDRLHREENLKEYLMLQGHSINHINKFGFNSSLFASDIQNYFTEELEPIYNSLAYYYELNTNEPTERNPLDIWAKTLETTYTSNDLIEEYYIIDEEGKPHRVEEIHRTPTEIYFKPKQERNPAHMVLLKKVIHTYIENGIPFSRSYSDTHTLPTHIQLNGKVYDLQNYFTIEPIEEQQPQIEIIIKLG